VEIVIREAQERTQIAPITDPVLKGLVEIEETIQQLSQVEVVNGDVAMKQADNLLKIATDIVETLTEEKVEEQ
jgi:hypothetical protein